jgi:hypothetical protein
MGVGSWQGRTSLADFACLFGARFYPAYHHYIGRMLGPNPLREREHILVSRRPYIQQRDVDRTLTA